MWKGKRTKVDYFHLQNHGWSLSLEHTVQLEMMLEGLKLLFVLSYGINFVLFLFPVHVCQGTKRASCKLNRVKALLRCLVSTLLTYTRTTVAEQVISDAAQTG